MLLGTTSAGRILAVILDPEEETIFYAVTAQPASRKERHRYQVEQAGTQQ
jgi:uncharacterized DUF497 family protein